MSGRGEAKKVTPDLKSHAEMPGMIKPSLPDRQATVLDYIRSTPPFILTLVSYILLLLSSYLTQT